MCCASALHRRLFFIVALVLALAAPLDAQKPAESKPQPLTIRAIGTQQDWKTDLPTVNKVLHAAAAELWQYFPDHKLDPILVEPRGGPIVLFRRGKNGEYFVRLNTGETYWAQYVYQFSHEVCHILGRYREQDESNKWFEESLCELASLFVLRQLSERWEKEPPYKHWKGKDQGLHSYAADRIKTGALPPGKTLAQWRRDNADALTKNATNREKNQIAATMLLPLFEKSPQHWEAIWHLNQGENKPRTFDEYLRNWHDHAPAKHQAFIRAIANEFEVRINVDEKKANEKK